MLSSSTISMQLGVRTSLRHLRLLAASLESTGKNTLGVKDMIKGIYEL